MRRATTSLITLLLLTGCQSTENESVVARSLKAELGSAISSRTGTSRTTPSA